MLFDEGVVEIKKVIEEVGGKISITQLNHVLVTKNKTFKNSKEIGWYLKRMDGFQVMVDKSTSMVSITPR